MRLKRREAAGARHSVIVQGAAQKFAVIVVVHLLDQCLTDSLCQTTVNLTGHQYRAHNWSAVVHGDVSEELHFAGFREDFHHCGVRTEREGGSAWSEEIGGLQTAFHVVRQSTAVGECGDLSEGDTGIRHTLHAEFAILHFDVFHRGFQNMRGDGLGFLLNLAEACHQRGTTDCEPTATHGAVTGWGVGGIAVMHDHGIEIGTDNVGCHLGERRFLSLTVRRDASEDAHLTAWFHTNRAALERTKAADFDIAGETDADVSALFAQSLLFGTEIGVIDLLNCLVQRLVVVTAIVLRTSKSIEWKLIGLNEVLATDIYRIQSRFTGQQIHNALDVECGFWSAGTAIGPVGASVGVHREHVVIDGWDIVASGGHDERGVAEIEALWPCSCIHQNPTAESRDFAILSHGRLNFGDLISAVAAGEHVLGSGLDPLHRLLEFVCGRGNQIVLVIGTDFLTKSTTDFWCNHSHLGLTETKRPGDGIAIPVGSLGTGPHGEPMDWIRLRSDSATFHRHGIESRVVDDFLDGPLRLAESCIYIATAMSAVFRPDVVWHVGIEARSIVLHGLVDIGEDREGIDIHHHHFSGINSFCSCFRHHHRYWMTDIAHGLLSKWGNRRLRNLAILFTLVAFANGFCSDICEERFEIFAGVHGHHTWHRFRGLGVVSRDGAVWFDAAYDNSMQHSGDFEIVYIGG